MSLGVGNVILHQNILHNLGDMYSHMITIPLENFPRSFRLLQQEAILTRTCIMTGFEFLIKGNFHDAYKGNYYSAFFQLSIGVERLLKLVMISDHMVVNNFIELPAAELKKLGHNITNLYEMTKEVSSRYSEFDSDFANEESLDYKLLLFLNSFAKSSGRYYNISNISSPSLIDPLEDWKELIEEIVMEDFKERHHHKIERKVFNNINLSLQMQHISSDTGYVDQLYNFVKTSEANRFAIWHIGKALTPLVHLLDKISMRCHDIETSTGGSNYPSIPYFNEVFTFIYLNKTEFLKRNKWNVF